MNSYAPDAAALSAALEYTQSIVDTVRDPMLVLDIQLRVQTASRNFCKTFHVSTEETEGQLVYELGNGQWDIPRLRELLEVILPEQSSFNDMEVEHDFPQIGHRIMLLNARKLWRSQNHTNLILLAIEDVTERRQLERENRRANELYGRLLSSSNDCIKLLDLDGRLLSMNECGLKALNIRDVRQVLGACWLDYWQGEGRQATQKALEEARQGRSSEFEGHFVTPDSVEHWWSVAVSPVLQDGQPEYILAVSRNINDRKQHEAFVEKAQLELKRSNEDLEQFARIAAHDLRAPIRTMVQSAQLLERMQKATANERTQELFGYIISNGRQMAQLLDDMLRYATVAHTHFAAVQPVSAMQACAQAVEHLGAKVKACGATLHCLQDEKIKVWLPLSLLAQVFQNLMSNAMHYARAGVPPVVHVSAQSDKDCWKFTLQDNGLGIEADHLESIFEPFLRLHGSDRPGSGIGLATCRRVIERAGGKIWVESVVGVGSAFTFLLPKAA